MMHKAHRKTLLAGAAVLTLLGGGLFPAAASAHVGVRLHFGFWGPGYWPAPYYDRYYYGPPVYYAPPAVIYRQPPEVVYLSPPAPQAAAPAAPPQECREYQSTVTVNGQPQRVYGTACRQPDGTWQIVN